MEPSLPLDAERLLTDAVREVLAHEDPQRFLTWMRSNIRRYYSGPVVAERGRLSEDPRGAESGTRPVDPAFLALLASAFGRAIWNAVPLPGNGFRPKPLPTPGRNDPCPCGSGRKYKDCCRLAPTPPLSSEDMWPVVLQHLPRDTLRRALAADRIPAQVLVGLASDYLDQGKPKKGAALLEPLFADPARKGDAAHDAALNLLCSLYDALGQRGKKMALLDRVVSTAGRSPLRSGAWQRLATIRMDEGDPARAWEAFGKAQRDDPEAPAVGLLEVQLLLAQDRNKEAQERAGFVLKRLRRQGFEEDDGAVAFLRSVIRSPTLAMAELGMATAGGAGERLLEWWAKVADQPLPRYAVTKEPAPTAATGDDARMALAEHLRRMGVREDQMEPALEALSRQIRALRDQGGEQGGDQGLADEQPPGEEVPGMRAEPPSSFLEPPREVLELEQEWHRVFNLAKPFSTQDRPFGDVDPWEPAVEARWTGWLTAHPQAADSLDILDDLASAILLHPHAGTAWVDETLLGPVLARADAIVRQVLEGVQDACITWAFTENRPVLRSLVRRIGVEIRCGHSQAGYEQAQWVLRLNPDDNHGLRGLVMKAHLRAGDDAAALALAGRYPHEPQPELPFGQVLALFRQKRLDEAQRALCEALEHLPKVPRYLLAERVRKPLLSPLGITMGGDDQAWLYREDMRAVWAATAGALDWLRQAERRCKRAR